MKDWFCERFRYAKFNLRVLVIKSLLLILGMFIMALGIALYIPTGLGKSQVDFAVFTFAYLGLGRFASDGDVVGSNYSTVLILFYVVAMTIAAIFGLIAGIREYKKSKLKAIWVSFGIIIVTDLVITFVFPYMVNFFANGQDSEKSKGVFNLVELLSNWFASFDDEAMALGVRSWVFVMAFIVYCFGIALWVKSTWAPGPYNSICTQFMKMTKLNYTISRILCDLMIVAPALVVIWFIDGDSVSNFFMNFSIATMVFIFISGPVINLMVKYIDKILDYKKITRNHTEIEAQKIASTQ